MIHGPGLPTALRAADVRRLGDVFLRNRVPVLGSFELTRSCNLACVHCYLDRAPGGGTAEDLSLDRWLDILDQVTDAGCLNLLLTGGEPLLRADFPEIYRRARENGLVVTLFTNATLVTPDIVDLLRDLPPSELEVSLYGATARTHDSVTGVPGSHRLCLKGLGRLSRAGIRFSLKTMLLNLNLHELGEMKRLAADLGADFRFDSMLFPRLDGDTTPISYRVPPADAAAADFGDARLQDLWLRYHETMKELPAEESLFTCGAGLTSFHIDAGGRLLPCLLLREPAFDLSAGVFTDGWNGVISRFCERKAGPDYRCNACAHRALCGLCPAFFALENGSYESRSDYLCQTGFQRHQHILELTTTEVRK